MSIAEISGASPEVAILGRLFLDGKPPLTPRRARDLLDVDFSDADKERMRDLAARNGAGRLSSTEREELLGYAKAGCLLGILQSRARRTLAKRNGRPR